MQVFTYHPKYRRELASILEHGIMLGTRFDTYEVHIGIHMQFMSDRGLYGFAPLLPTCSLLRTAADKHLDTWMFERVDMHRPMTSQSSVEVVDTSALELMARSPLKKVTTMVIEIDADYNDVKAVIDDQRSATTASITNPSLRMFWREEVERRAVHKIEVEVAIDWNDSLNTHAANDLHFTESVESADWIKKLGHQQQQAAAANFSAQFAMPLTTLPVDGIKLANFHKSLAASKSAMWKAMGGRFAEYAARRRFRMSHNAAVDSDEEVGSDEEGAEVTRVNKQHVKHQYLTDFVGHSRRLVFEPPDRRSEGDDSAAIDADLRAVEVESMVDRRAMVSQSAINRGMPDEPVDGEEEELVTLSFTEDNPVLESIAVDHQL